MIRGSVDFGPGSAHYDVLYMIWCQHGVFNSDNQMFYVLLDVLCAEFLRCAPASGENGSLGYLRIAVAATE